MERVIWIGPPVPDDLRRLLSSKGQEIIGFNSVDAAVKGTTGLAIAVAVIAVDEAGAPDVVQRFCAARPDAQVLVSSSGGLPRPVLQSMWAGASGVVDLKAFSASEAML